jgi:hypothetical protein
MEHRTSNLYNCKQCGNIITELNNKNIPLVATDLRPIFLKIPLGYTDWEFKIYQLDLLRIMEVLKGNRNLYYYNLFKFFLNDIEARTQTKNPNDKVLRTDWGRQSNLPKVYLRKVLGDDKDVNFWGNA